MTISTVEEYDQATQRVAELAGCLEDTPEEAELIALVDAIARWDETHDDATAWQ